MANANEEQKEVKEFVERVEVTPAGDDEETVDEEEKKTPSESSEDENNEDESETETEKVEDEDESEEVIEKKPVDEVKNDDVKVILGETPRERALRMEVTRLKRLQRHERNNEILGNAKPELEEKKVAISPERSRILEKYKKEDLDSLREVVDVLAEDMGFVRKDQLGATTFQEKASEELDKFLEKHLEYLPENDKDNVLWNRFKEEYALYKQPKDPKDFKKIFERAHRDIFDIKPAGALKTINAAKEKIKVASHSSASAPGIRKSGGEGLKTTPGLRLDMLKGFSQEELAEFEGE